MGKNFDPKYKVRHRVTSISRLAKYTRPLPMAGDPPEASCGDWEKRCRIVYAYMIELKRGVIPNNARRGLWFHAEGHK